ncbi:MAG: hypothetical protein HKN25_01160 [Pyrinomonadaceae bacterium]|nr:hypothetical protein [Pyrinomonadaceae bacterium]
MEYVWIIWSLLMLGLWTLIFYFKRDYRRIMLPVSLVTMLFGLTEPLFVPEYWSPPSLFDLAARTGFDLESLIFSFAIGGIGSVIYGVLVPYKMAPMGDETKMLGRHRFHIPILLFPFFLFPVLSVSTNLNPIYVGIITLIVSSLATLYCRPDLKGKIWIGGMMFAVLYFFYFGSVLLFFPDYVLNHWNLDDLSGFFVLGIPIEEILFGFSFGMYWSSVFEHVSWSAIRQERQVKI